jgi:antitoxin component HigA of HigAB toxin-antitoxin module
VTNPSGRGEYRQLAPILPSLPCNASFEPTTVPHPGETVQEYLNFYGWSQRDLARRTGLTPKTISEICNGQGPITPTTALAWIFAANSQLTFCGGRGA